MREKITQSQIQEQGSRTKNISCVCKMCNQISFSIWISLCMYVNLGCVFLSVCVCMCVGDLFTRHFSYHQMYIKYEPLEMWRLIRNSQHFSMAVVLLQLYFRSVKKNNVSIFFPSSLFIFVVVFVAFQLWCVYVKYWLSLASYIFNTHGNLSSCKKKNQQHCVLCMLIS